jgi:hypothetical protein
MSGRPSRPPRTLRMPSPAVTLSIALAGALGGLAVLRGVFDTDYFWHFATGRLIVQTGSIPRTDPFSFTWFGQPWISDQWLSELFIYRLVELVGIRVGLFIFGVLAAVAFGILMLGVVRFGARFLAAAAAGVLAAAVALPQITMRPQVLSLPLLAAVIVLLLHARPERRWTMLILPPLFLVWANLHGMYVVGLGVGFVYLIATLLGRTPMAGAWRWLLAAGFLSLLATMVTPLGPYGIIYSLSFGDPNDWGAQNISEWQSPNFHDPQVLPLLALIVAVVALGGGAGPGWLRTIGLAGIVMSLLAVRSIGVGALMAMPPLALALDARLPRRAAAPGRPVPQVAGRRWIELATAVLVVVGVTAGSFARVSGQPEVSNARFPVRGTTYLEQHDPTARVLTRYGWGGYLLEQLAPLGGRVFADGRMHKYAPQVIADYSTIVAVGDGWQSLLQHYEVGALLLSPEMALARGPAQQAGWCEVYHDDLQVLLLRTCDQLGS